MSNETIQTLAEDGSFGDQVTKLWSSTFNFDIEGAVEYRKNIGDENVLMLKAGDGSLAASLAMAPGGQFHGGRSLSMGGIAVVSVKPEFRGDGSGTRLMKAAVNWMHQRGLALSCLYPAVWSVYRRAGYELAGYTYKTMIQLQKLAVRAEGMTIREAITEDHEVIQQLYLDRATTQPGFIDRSEWYWKRIWRHKMSDSIGYVAEHEGRVEGYIIHAPTGRSKPSARTNLLVLDMMASTGRAAEAIMQYLGGWGTVFKEAVAYQEWSDLIPASTCRMHIRSIDEEWMLRIIDATAALEQRGYPESIQGSVEVKLSDDVIEQNNKVMTLEFKNGRCSVTPGGEGRLGLDARTLAPLFSGFQSASDLTRLGRITGGTPEDLQLLDAAFAGRTPTMNDSF